MNLRYNQMNILHVIPDLLPESGGPVTAIKGLANAQSALGHNVAIATTYSSDDYKLRGDFEIHAYPCEYNRWRLSFSLVKALPKLISEADMVHLHTIWEFPLLAAAKVAKKLEKPYILRPCGMLDKWSLDNAAAIHFTLEGEKNNSWRGSNENRSFVLPIGLSTSAYQDLPARHTFFIRFPELKGLRVVLFLGRLHTKKQPEVVIRAFQRVYMSNPDIHLVMAGPGDKDYVEKLKWLVKELKVNENVTFTGMLIGDAVREAYRAAEILVLPSLQENFGIAVAEAMAAGCPVVVSNKVDLAPDISDAKAGLVCLPDVEPTAQAMKRILKDKTLRNRMSDNGRRLVLNKFTWDKIANELFLVVEDILSGKRTSSAWR
jgi:glycosyltransferase involved in cell wall biosynthesis